MQSEQNRTEQLFIYTQVYKVYNKGNMTKTGFNNMIRYKLISYSMHNVNI